MTKLLGFIVMSLQQLIQTRQLKSALQPIVDTYRSALIGYEGLIRGPKGHELERPDALFAAAVSPELRHTLELHCAQSALTAFDTRHFAGLLFINIDPNILALPSTFATFEALKAEAKAPIVLELSEHHPVASTNALKQQILKLRTIGYRFAIDDLGAGHSSFKLWAEIRPDFVKVDRYFIKDIDKSPYKREFVQHIVTLARNLHATVIAEGIETEDELRQLQKLGIFAMQGYLIGRPNFEPFQLESLQLRIADEVAVNRFDTVSNLLEDTTVITSQRKVADILDYFKQSKRLLSIPVVDDGKVVGIVRRGHFMETMSSAFGRALFSNKPAQAIMQRNFLTIDAEAPLEKASALLTEHEDTIEHQVLLVTRQQQYIGVIPVPSLLRRITESKIQNARYANPLTLLPGNVPINQYIDQQISQEHAFCVLYFDLNYFKPFNDEYGYQQGDAVIQWFASLLERQYASLGHFVGHVGGDDFMVIVTGADHLDAVQQKLRQQFKCDVKSFYREQHLVDNFMLGRARNGRYQKFPLLDFSLAVVAVAANTAASHQDISIAAARLKSQAKRASNGVAVCQFADLALNQSSALC